MSVFVRARKAQLKGRVALCGPTGSGKTWTALAWARTLGARVALIDTEHGSAQLYADDYEFDTVRFEAPYAPERLVKVLKLAESEGYDVVVVDSFSHFWEGEGGVLDVVDGAGQRAQGNKFAGWKVGTPMQQRMVETMLKLDAHVIVTMRSKMEYVLETDSRGKQVPRRVGMAPVQRAGVEYEFTVVGDLDLEHRLVISKSRCHVLADLVVQPNREVEAAEQFKAWLDTGVAEDAAVSGNGAADGAGAASPLTAGEGDAADETAGPAGTSVDTEDDTHEGEASPPQQPDETDLTEGELLVMHQQGTPVDLVFENNIIYRNVGHAAADAGLDDDGRHDLSRWASAGRVASSKELTVAEAQRAIRAATAIKTGGAEFVRDGEELLIVEPKTGFLHDVQRELNAERAPSLDDTRAALKVRLTALGDAGKAGWKAAGLPALSKLTVDQLPQALTVVDDLETRPF